LSWPLSFSLSLLWHLRFRYEHTSSGQNAFISFCHRNLFQTCASREKEKELLFGAMMDLRQVPHAAKLFYHGARKQSAISLSTQRF
jgi:hypothetical protein